MLAEEFVNRKRANWERLQALLDRAANSLERLSAEEIHEVGRLYRQATSDLAVARRDYARHPVAEYLNGLVGRSHGQLYGTRSGEAGRLARFFVRDLPETFRQSWPHIFAAALLFLLPALAAFFVTWRSPELLLVIFPGTEQLLADIESGTEWWQAINEGRSSSAALIMTNNIRVALLAFAGGILAGSFTMLVLVQNGLLLGAVAGTAQHYGFSGRLWDFVTAHAAVELSVIVFAGGAGLQLGWALVRPGLLTRRAALVLAARRALILAVGCALFLILAGIIEGFISPSELPYAVKAATALLSGGLMYAYLIVAGRQPATP